MNITAKSRYALKFMMDLAEHHSVGPQQRMAVAKRNQIPVDFLDHITAELKRAYLIQSYRGRYGGFELLRHPKDILLWDIFFAVEDHVYPVKCLETNSCAFEPVCNSHDVWGMIFNDIKETLQSRNLEDMVFNWTQKKTETPMILQAAVLTLKNKQNSGCGRDQKKSYAHD
jgi:Rrf2 family protein